MGDNAYSDTGYRFRRNNFARQDGWLVPIIINNPFYDYIFYNSDTYPRAPDGLERMVAEMYFRMDVDQISHSRDVYYFMDFIGDIGGIGEILLQICGWVFGGYAAFHAMFSTIAVLYRHKANENPFAKSKKEQE